MNDDTLLREALRADAAGVEADDDLLDAIRAEVDRRPGEPGRPPAAWVLTAAAVLVAAALVAVAAVRDRGGDDVSTVDPATSPTTADPLDPVDPFLMPEEVPCREGESLDVVFYTNPMTRRVPLGDLVAPLRADDRVASVRTLSRTEIAEMVREDEGVDLAADATPDGLLVDLVDAGRDEADFRRDADIPPAAIAVVADIGCTDG